MKMTSTAEAAEIAEEDLKNSLRAPRPLRFFPEQRAKAVC